MLLGPVKLLYIENVIAHIADTEVGGTILIVPGNTDIIYNLDFAKVHFSFLSFSSSIQAQNKLALMNVVLYSHLIAEFRD